jgi:hypothetical protein
LGVFLHLNTENKLISNLVHSHIAIDETSAMSKVKIILTIAVLIVGITTINLVVRAIDQTAKSVPLSIVITLGVLAAIHAIWKPR